MAAEERNCNKSQKFEIDLKWKLERLFAESFSPESS